MSVAKKVQKVLGDKKFVDKIIQNSRNMDEVYSRLGYVLSYIISTRSKGCPELEGVSPDYLTQEPEWKKLDKEQLVDNIIINGYVTHSFNGCNLKSVKKYGLGDSRIYDKSLGKDLDDLCSLLGDSEFTEKQGGGSDETYYTAPGAKTFHYACGYSPERLWLGPLRQDRNNALPIKVGESKVDYALRVLKNKVSKFEDSVSADKLAEIFEKGKRVIEKMCSQKPVVALIPINSKKHNLTAYQASTKMQYAQPPMLASILKNGTGSYSISSPETFFTEQTAFAEFNNLGNLVHVGHILPSQLEFFEVEDSFSLMQRKAMLNGLKMGEEIDFFTGNKYIPKQPVVEKVAKEEIDKYKEPEVEIYQENKQNVKQVKEQETELQ